MVIGDFVEKSKNIHGNRYDYSLIRVLSNTKKVEVVCVDHGIFSISPYLHISGIGCSKCAGNRKLTTGEFIKLSRDKYSKYNFKYDKTIYNGYTKYCTITCLKHGDFIVKPDLHLNGNSHCNLCSDRKNWNFDYFKNESSKIHLNRYKYDEYSFKNSTTITRITCEKHGDFYQSPESHLRQGCGCPKCKISKGENKIFNILSELKINHIQQKTFPDCKHIQELKFDFYLPELNTCIEFNGRQHYEPVSDFGGDIEFEKIKIRDSIKNIYCLNNNINLIIIKYTDDEVKQKICSLLYAAS
jgi:hypothetical protein